MKTAFLLIAIAYLLLGWLLLHQAQRVLPMRYYIPIIVPTEQPVTI